MGACAGQLQCLSTIWCDFEAQLAPDGPDGTLSGQAPPHAAISETPGGLPSRAIVPRSVYQRCTMLPTTCLRLSAAAPLVARATAAGGPQRAAQLFTANRRSRSSRAGARTIVSQARKGLSELLSLSKK